MLFKLTKRHTKYGVQVLRLKKGKKTKELTKKLVPGDWVLIKHSDIDWVAAEALDRCGVKGIINAEHFITGSYPNLGPSYLLKRQIPMGELSLSEEDFEIFTEETEAKIEEDLLLVEEKKYPLKPITEKEISQGLDIARENLPAKLREFTKNTLEYAEKELGLLTKSLPIDGCLKHLKAKIQEKEAVVVVRGKDYREDLRAIRSFIEDRHPTIVAVDGGADALFEMGFRPDIIVGDMDSVTDKVLKLTPARIVHAYVDGRAPGKERLDKMGLESTVIPCEGTSEDLAVLLLDQLNAAIIITVGSHSNMIDFLEKGRQGMASTFLTRLRSGDKLIDAKGLSVIYRARPKNTYALMLILAAFIPLMVLLLLSPPVASWLKIFLRQLKF